MDHQPPAGCGKLLQLGVDDLITDKPEIIAPLLARDKALDNRLLWLRDQIQELLAAPDAEEAMEVEETIEDAIEDPEEVWTKRKKIYTVIPGRLRVR